MSTCVIFRGGGCGGHGKLEGGGVFGIDVGRWAGHQIGEEPEGMSVRWKVLMFMSRRGFPVIGMIDGGMRGMVEGVM